MLSPEYMWPQVYRYVPSKYQDWSFRHKLLQLEILKLYKSDIMCFQEMTNFDYNNFWSPELYTKFNMGSKFIQKLAPKYWQDRPLDTVDGCSIFYNKDKFKFISSKGIYLNQLLRAFNEQELDYLSKQELSLTNGAGDPIGDTNLLKFLREKNQVCLFVSLRHIPTGLIFVVINTHLYWKYDSIKLSQCMIIMRELKQIVNDLLKDVNGQPDISDKRVRILFTGDLNSTSDSAVINFLRGQIIQNTNLNMINPMRHYLNHCVYDDIPKEWFTHTCYSGKLQGIFDYIWYHDTHFQLTKVLTGVEVSTELQAKGQPGLPNENHPSDHIPIVTEFQVIDEN